MKNAVNKLLVLVGLLWAQFALAQDVQELYDSAKGALLNGDYITALTKISDAKAQIGMDPKLDPNGVFKNKLLPKIENAANAMANIASALEQLYNTTQIELVFPDVSPSREVVNQYTQQAKNASEQLLAKRDSILASYELDPEFREALRNNPAFKQIEQFASAEIVEKLSQKFAGFVLVLTDSINAINSRYQTLATNLEKMKRSATASKADRKKLEEHLDLLSQERTNYMNAISEILMGETAAKNDQIQMILMDKNLDNVFNSAITSEIQRVEAISEVDSVGYKELLNNYERMKKYNEIFAKNNVTGDLSALLGQYEAAIKNVKVIQPGGHNYFLYLAIAAAGIILIFAIYKIVVSFKKTKKKDKPLD
jgi:lipoate synthase